MSILENLYEAIHLANEDIAKGIFIKRNDAQLIQHAQELDAKSQRVSHNNGLYGKPVVIKGNIDIEGLATTAGSLCLNATPAIESAPLIKRLMDAGALPMGHANMSELAFSGLGLNPHYGSPLNVLDSTLVPGGSSSGCASAIALGIAEFAIGSDTSGSTRVPAAYQGIVGFRPTMGRYDDTGIFPLAPSLDTAGPMARTVAGIKLLDDILRIEPEEPPKQSEIQPSNNLIIPTQEDLGALDIEIEEMFEKTVDKLIKNGFNILRRPIPALKDVRHIFDQYGTLVAAEAPQILSQYIALDDLKLDENIRLRLSQAKSMTTANIQAIRSARKKLQVQLQEQLNDSLLLMPTVASPPPSLETVMSLDGFTRENKQALSLTMLGAYLDMPSLALPIGDNKPGHSISISGVSGYDQSVLNVAERIESLLS